MVMTRAQGLSFPTADGGIEMSRLDLSDVFFDGGMLWDTKALELSLKLHFENTVKVKDLREQFSLVLGHHKMIPFIERYIDLAEKQRMNGTGDLDSVPMKECADRASKIKMTPNEATTIMLKGRAQPQNR